MKILLFVSLVFICGCSKLAEETAYAANPWLVTVGQNTMGITKYCDKDNGNLIYDAKQGYGEGIAVVVGGCKKEK